ncbi:MAG TPA: hypothetical protein VJY41_04425 [Prolixibacteraceae bacterium]|nr:hypothetical protein [Prolixibacteraceae bacterium]
MIKEKPFCLGKCKSCFFYYTCSCVAKTGDDFFTHITLRQIELVLNNLSRFSISPRILQQLIDKQNQFAAESSI